MPKFVDVAQADHNGVLTVAGVGEVFSTLSEQPVFCMVCAEPTSWFEVCAEGPICSTECSAKFWSELNDACRRSDEACGDPCESDIGF